MLLLLSLQFFSAVFTTHLPPLTVGSKNMRLMVKSSLVRLLSEYPVIILKIVYLFFILFIQKMYQRVKGKVFL